MSDDLTGKLGQWNKSDVLVTLDQRFGHDGSSIQRNLHLQVASGNRESKAYFANIDPQTVAIYGDQQKARDRNAADVLGWRRDFPHIFLPLSRNWL